MGFGKWVRNLFSKLKGKDSDEGEPSMRRSWSFRRSKIKKKHESNPGKMSNKGENKIDNSAINAKQDIEDILSKELNVNKVEESTTTEPNQDETASKYQVSQIVDEYEMKCLNRINEILDKSKELDTKIDTFSDVIGSQQFYYIDEILQRNIEKLDRIDIRESTRLSEERKNVIKFIYEAIERLEVKAKENECIHSNGIKVD